MKNQNQPQKEYALADVVLRMVLKENDRLKLHPRAAEGFKGAVDALFAHPTLDVKEELDAVVRLGWLFQRDRQLELADAIIELVAQEPRALSVLGISAGRTTREAKKQFAKLVSGTNQKLEAPVFGKEAPKGSMKVSAFLEPGGDMRRKATAARRTEGRRLVLQR
jgi:hypothetical protein